MSWNSEKRARLKVSICAFELSKDQPKEKNLSFSIQRSVITNILSNKYSLIEIIVVATGYGEKFFFRDSAKLISHFGVFDSSYYLSKQGNNGIFNQILKRKLQMVSWRFGVENQACSNGDIWAKWRDKTILKPFFQFWIYPDYHSSNKLSTFFPNPTLLMWMFQLSPGCMKSNVSSRSITSSMFQIIRY